MRKLWLACILVLALLPTSVGAVQVGKIAAVVNGKAITMFDLQRAAASELRKINPNDTKAVDAVMRKVLDSMIMDILVQQEAARLKIKVSPSEVDARIADIMKSSRLTKQQFEAALARDGLSVAQLRKNIERQILGQRVLGVTVGRRTVVTPEEVAAYYEKHKDTLYDREGLHMAMLVYHPNAPANQAAQQIKNKQLTFAAACAKYSVLQNRDRGGDEGKIDWQRLNPELSERLQKMKPGTVSDIFMIRGFRAQIYLFKPGVTEYKPMTLQQATPMITEILRMPKSKDRYEDYSTQLKKKAVIDIRL